MKRVLEQLYDGELAPEERFRTSIQGYHEVQERSDAAYVALKKKLPQELHQELDAVLEEGQELLSFQQEQSFIEGFTLGATLLIEVFQERGALPRPRALDVTQ